MGLRLLTEISNFYGNDEEMVLLGGGNTSYKDENYLYVKASGTTLKTITEDGFVKMDRSKLARIWDKTYSDDIKEREAAALADLMDARDGDEKRPSVETLLHDLFPQKFVVHTHPTLVNALTCAKDGFIHAERLFGDGVLWLPPTMPGYVLAKDVRDVLIKYKKKTGTDADVLFLENHGVFVAADTIDEIKALTDKIIGTIKQSVDMACADEKIAGLLGLGWDKFAEKYGIFTPDHYVYRGDGLLFKDSVKIAVYAESFGGASAMPDWLTDFIANWEVENYRKSVTA
jgi:rhamnose utilization protein RhaD (predicted bifunctional aldolase and dehydrogenase)